MDLVFRYNANRHQIEAMPNLTFESIKSYSIMPVEDDWSKKEFFEKITRFKFDNLYYARLDTIFFLMKKIYGDLTKDEDAFYREYFRQLWSDPSFGYFD